LWVLAVLILFFEQQAVFWIPVIKPESNFDDDYTGDTNGFFTALVTIILFDKIVLHVYS
jgi:hypothetical protein